MSLLAEASATIDSPIGVVWRAMIDVDSYPAWNPFILRIDAPGRRPLAVGDELILHVRWRDGKEVKTHERITRLEPPAADGDVMRATLEYEFRGPVAVLNLTRGRRVQTVEQRAGGRSVYRTSERLHGLLARFTPIDKVRDGFERHAVALKRRAEALHNST